MNVSDPLPQVFGASEFSGELCPILPTSIEPAAVAVLKRLRQGGHRAYLVGGCVRDLLLGGTPKDFDVATSARPRQVKKLFRNARIIGRRFRLVHVMFPGNKTIEVSTFRRDPNEGVKVDDAELGLGLGDGLDEPVTAAAFGSGSAAGDGPEGDDELRPAEDGQPDEPADDRDAGPADSGNSGDDASDEDDPEEDLLIREDNVYGSEAEDAVRRDFTINGLFYDIETQAIVDYVGGVADLRRRVLRTIGDAPRRIREDPVRILRAVKFSTRLNLTLDPGLAAAMAAYHEDLRKSAAPRVFEEILRVLGGLAPEKSVERLVELGVFRVLFPELGFKPRIDEDDGRLKRLLGRLEALGAIDRGRRSLPTAIYVGVLLYDELSGRLTGSALPAEGPHLSPSQALDDYLRPIGQRCRMAKRDTARVRAMFLALRRIDPELQEGGAKKRRRRGGLGEFVRREFFQDALLLLRIVCNAEGRDLAPVREWEERQEEIEREAQASRSDPRHDHRRRPARPEMRQESRHEPRREEPPVAAAPAPAPAPAPPEESTEMPRRRRRRRRRHNAPTFEGDPPANQEPSEY